MSHWKAFGLSILASISAAMLIGLLAPSAQAGYVVYLRGQGGEVVATGSGAIDLTGLTLVHGFVEPELNASDGFISIGGSGPAELDIYISNVATGTLITGPASFGSGGHVDAGSSDDPVGIFGLVPELFLPAGYVSDSPLSDTATFGGTLDQLGVTRGGYEWTWGSGANQNFTLIAIPESSTWAMMLLGYAGLGYAGYRRSQRPVSISQTVQRRERGTRRPSSPSVQ
jgi:hypothetical protein